ncbi:unnamed protein product [Bursaphelenchus xylophilus]|uniref:(pine wood nematode) hypothetical protein n=1 Tax=Bursaphelenchus xylophilus TaxID=6326 RepID=A0A1I7RR22_BURXY|nr:unnamed protein product [Bursaphelenchus xylophilus]CAG9130810.1 unnamed protein product [Bursaphelenchus xylophilus]
MSHGVNRFDFLTRFAQSVDQCIRPYSLLDIPRGWQWKLYWFSVHIHVALTSILMVLGISCFCTGVQQSFLYEEINCGDGVSITAPIANIFVVYYSLMAVKQQNNYWSVFEQFVITVVVFILNIFFLMDQLFMGIRWSRTTSRDDQNWPLHFMVVDFLLVTVLSAIEITCGIVIVLYTLLITNWASWQQRAQRNIALANQRRRS